jgi:hypothetical protein
MYMYLHIYIHIFMHIYAIIYIYICTYIYVFKDVLLREKIAVEIEKNVIRADKEEFQRLYER